ncbi:hypothetical protein PSECIP111951_01492 [Pseudoalteromonas holothuriae]|uniref:Dystroglycan-type cadherin-like domain-containing protein n=1 Tax=Pseudoalteromonas holothuriae TaxID=2963714 RepID=A0ABM9GI88_9GAMM|nr:Ig-like domain-containing protein [Pseudoalteromonas sp. CIP111951]CAH9056592.1 hypothetical protein PSECIP111951_01492 [Pseudoalteromonas sp. CIP111951]
MCGNKVSRYGLLFTWLMCMGVLFTSAHLKAHEKPLLLVDKQVQTASAFDALSGDMDIQPYHLDSSLLPQNTNQPKYSELHLMSHGGPGWLLVNGQKIHNNTHEYEQFIAHVESLLSPTGKLYLYGCDVAKGEQGKYFVDKLHKRLNRPVYASINKTGNVKNGGDWVLEYSSTSSKWQLAQNMAGFEGVLAHPSDVTFQNGGPALLSDPVTFNGVTYSHNLPATGKMARYNDSVDGRDRRFGITDELNADNALLYHISDGGVLTKAPVGDVDYRFKSSNGDEFRLVSMEAGSITDITSVENTVNHIVTITGYKNDVSAVSETVDFTQAIPESDPSSITYVRTVLTAENQLTTFNDGVLTFDESWQDIDEVRFTTTGQASKVTFVVIDTIDFEAAVSDNAPPAMTSLNLSGSPSGNDTTVTYTAVFDESATNVSTDDFTLSTVTGNASGTIASVSASSGSSITVTVNGISGTGSIRLDLNANTNIVDGLGNGNNTNGYVASFNGAVHAVDTVAPSVSSVSASSNDGTYKVGDTVTVTVGFNEAITVTGSPTITLETGTTDRTATYSSGSGSDTLSFAYTVQSGDVSSDLSYTSTSALALAGGTLNDAGGNAATLTLVTPGATNSLSANKALVIDGVAPVVSSVSSTTTNGLYKVGDSIVVTVTFDDAVTVTGTPTLTLETGANDRAASYVSGSGSTTLNFSYTVQSNDVSSDLAYVSTSALALAGGSISDSAGNNASLALATPGATNSLSASKALVIDGVVPTVSSVSSFTANGTYKVGDSLTITVTFSENVTVTGTPTLTLETGTNDRVASYISGSGGTLLSFSYTVQSGDLSNDLAYTTSSALALNGGSINDSSGNTATLTLPTPSTANSLSANKAFVIDGALPTLDASNSTPANGSYGLAANGNLVMSFSEAVALGTGNITLVNAANSSVIETFNVATGTGSNGGTVTVNGNTVIINPGTDLSAGVGYAVQVDTTAITDSAGNTFVGITNNTTYAVTVAANVVLSVDNTSILEKSGQATVTLTLKDSASNDFNAPANVSVTLSFGGTATGSGTDYSLGGSIAGNTVTISSGSASQTFTITGIDDAPTSDDGETVIVDVNTVTTGNAAELVTQQVTITLDENNPPVFTGLDATPNFTENGSAVVFDLNVAVSDTELDALSNGNGDYNGASLTIARNGGANTSDTYGNTGQLGALTQGQTFDYNNTSVGTVTANSAGTLTLTFNSNATTAIVGNVLRNISYSNSSEAPSTSATLNWTFNDGVSNSEGTNQIVVSITEVNDAPTLDNSQTPVLTAINEDVSGANNTGVEIDTLVVDNSIGDVDGGVVEAIAVTMVDNTNGSWQYSTDNGSNWSDFSVTTGQSVDLTTAARLLDGTLTVGTTQKIRFVPSEHYNGSATFTFIAWDKSSGTAGDTADATNKGGMTAFSNVSDTASITINAQPDAPTLSMAASLNYTENALATSLDSQASATDPDGDASWQGNGAKLVALISSGGLAEDSLSISSSNFTISNSQLSYQNSVIGTISETSGTVNDGVVSGGDTLTVNLSASTNAITQALVRALSYQNSSNNPSTAARTVTVQLTDNETSSISDNVAVNVSAVNDAPTITGTPTLTIAQNEAYSFLPTGSDVDSTTLTYSIQNSPTWLNFNTSNGSITGTPGNSDVGTAQNIVITVTDGTLSASLGAFNLVVTNVNDAPSITGTPNTKVSQNDTYSFTPQANDIDNDSLSFNVANAPSWLTLDSNSGLLSGVPQQQDVGTASGIVLSVSDGSVSVNLPAFSIEVVNVNDAPTITGTPATSILEGEQYSFIPSATDLDGDALTFSVANLPSWATFSASTGAVAGVPGKGDIGTTSGVIVSVSDGSVSVNLPAFSIEVVNVNDAPTITGTPATSILEGEQYSFIPSATDLDGDALTFSVANLPSWATFSTATGTISGVPDESDIGTTSGVVVSVSDGTLSSSLAAFNLTVLKVNTAPVVTPQTLSLEEDATLGITASATDAQNDTLTFAIVSPPSNGTLTQSNVGWVYQPVQDFNGQDSFSYTASDAELTSEPAVVSLEITPLNDEPNAQDDTFTLVQNSSNTYTLSVLNNDSDVDGDTLIVQGAKASIGSVSVAQGALQYQAPDGFSGEVQFSYAISDGNTGRDTADVDLQITGESDGEKPVLTVPNDVTVNATGLFTKVDLGVASAVDSLGNPVPVSLVDRATTFAPGLNSVYWQAVDDNDLKTIAKQQVTVMPLISLSKDQVVTEGNSVSVDVLLNGPAPSYPVTVNYSVSGSADGTDHDVQSGVVTISSGTRTSIQFSVFSDSVVEQVETVVISLDAGVNLGNKSQTTVRIFEGNITPVVKLNVEQSTETRLTVAQNEGLVNVLAQATDANPQDQLTLNWNSSLTNQSAQSNLFTFDPSVVTPGVYPVTVTVTDSASPALSGSETVYIDITTELAALSSEDSDGDLIPDDQEGYADSDGDGIADFLDAIDECNVVPGQVTNQNAFLAEGDPGVCLRKGAVAAQDSRGGLELSDDTQQGNISADSEVTNVGGVFDYIAYGLPEVGQTYRLVLPQTLPIPANAVYRKYTDAQGWRDFVENGNNQVFSSAGEAGYCPPPGDALWQAGLTEGHWCVQLEIEDGGPNDADEKANGTIVDPSGVGVFLSDNQIPVANADTFSMQWNSSAVIDVLENDTDADGDTLTIAQASAQFGVVEVTAEQQLRFTPAANFVGEDVISYSITDSQGGTSFSTVTVTVVGNQAPVAQNDSAQTANRSLVVIDVLANDSDAEGDELTITQASASNGDTFINEGKSISYVPNAGFAGEDMVMYRISDGKGGVGEAMVVVTVAENMPPEANPNRTSVDYESTVLIDVLSNDSDPESDTLTLTLATADVGAVTIMDNGLLRYTPKSGYVGMDTITYTVQDEFGAQAIGVVSVQVTKPVSDGSGGSLLWLMLLLVPFGASRRLAIKR